jgi:hypothetical protein
VQTPSPAALELVTRNPIQPGRMDSVEVLTFPAAVAYPGCDFAGRAAATNTLGDRKGSESEETLKTLRRLDDVAGLMRLLSR